jgi:hypothetical protein
MNEKEEIFGLDNLLKNMDPILEENVKASMIIAAEIDNEMKARGWDLDEFHRQCNAVIPNAKSNYGLKKIENWLKGTHDFKISELIIIRKVLGEDWLNKIEKI